MKHIPLETKEAIVRQVLSAPHRTVAEIAKHNGVGFSTLQTWLRAKREGRPLSVRRVKTSKQTVSNTQRLNHLLATSKLDDVAVSVYCREHGLYSHQLATWKKEFMSDPNQKPQNKEIADMRALKLEIKKLKRDLHRKDKALAEASALLILKKKADAIWGDPEDD